LNLADTMQKAALEALMTFCENRISNSKWLLLNLVKSIKNRRKVRKMQIQFFWIPGGQLYNFYKALPYFFLTVFAWNIEMWKPRSVVSPNPQVIYSWILDMLCVIPCLAPIPKVAQSYVVNLFIWVVSYLCRICLDDFCI
jgi:hypothetical protein